MVSLELLKQPELGENAKRLRESLGVKVIDFAKWLGVSRQSVYNFESGQRQSMELLQGYIRLQRKGGLDV